MRSNDALRDKLITYLQDAHAMEHQITQVLEKQVQDTEKYPEIQAQAQRHLDETRMHEQRMADCLSAYNEKPSSVKSAGTSLLGAMIGAAAGARTDSLAKAARDDYMTEHMEIAAYESLIATAQACGDTDTIQACQANLRDELRMAQWLEQHIPDAVAYSLQEDGIALDESQIPEMRRMVTRSLQQARAALGGAASGATQQPPATGLGWNPDRSMQSESSLMASGSEATSDLYPPRERGAEENPSI